MSSPRQQVGGRQSNPSPRPWGGRYLDICTLFEVSEKKSRDPRLDELREMGLNGFWRSLAEQIGYDAFMLVWAAMSDQASQCDDGHRLYIPSFESYLRYQRNRYILALANSGSRPKEIKQRVVEDLNEDIHEMHISRLVRQTSGS